MFDLESQSPRCSASRLLLISMLLYFFVAPLGAQVTVDSTAGTESSHFAETPQEDNGDSSFRPVRTDSPRQTFRTFLRLKDDLELTLLDYRDDKTNRLYERMELITDQLIALIDLSLVPKASRREMGVDTVAYLLDILGRIELPDIDEAPDEDAFADDGPPRNGAFRTRRFVSLVSQTGRARENSCLAGERFGLHRVFIRASKDCLFDHFWGSKAGVAPIPRSPGR